VLQSLGWQKVGHDSAKKQQQQQQQQQEQQGILKALLA